MRGTKVPLNISYVELKQENINKNIYEIKYVCGYTVKFDPSHPKREIPQCINCQRYGHKKAFAIEKQHASSMQEIICNCKDTSKYVKCVLCKAIQPGNYQGCMI